MSNRFLVQNIQIESIKLVSRGDFDPCFQAQHWTMQYGVEGTRTLSGDAVWHTKYLLSELSHSAVLKRQPKIISLHQKGT